MTTQPKRPGRPAVIPREVVERVKQLCSGQLPYGAQKIVAIDHGMSQQHLCQILRGKRRADV